MLTHPTHDRLVAPGNDADDGLRLLLQIGLDVDAERLPLRQQHLHALLRLGLGDALQGERERPFVAGLHLVDELLGLRRVVLGVVRRGVPRRAG